MGRRLLREVEYRLRPRPGRVPSQLPLRLVAAHRGLFVETRFAHLDDRGRVWRLLDVAGPRDALEAAREVFSRYEDAHLVEKEVLGQSGSRLVLWYKYRPPRPGKGFSHTAFAFHHLGRETLLTDRAEPEGGLRIRILTPRAGRLPAFLKRVEANAGPVFDFELLYIGPPRESRSPLLSPQEEATLKAAHDLGVFDVPRRGTTRDLARRLKVSPSAVSYRLRRIMEKLARGALGP